MKNRQITFGALLSYSALAINIIITIFYTPWMIARIGKESYGLYTLAISIIGVFMLDFGLGSAVSRFVAKYNAENRTEKVNEFLSAVFKLYFLIDLIAFCVLASLYFFLGNIYQSLTLAELQQFRAIYVIVAGFNLVAFPMTPLAGILNAYEKFVWTKLCDLIYKFLSVGLVVFTLFWVSDVRAIVLANTLAGIAAIVLRLIAVRCVTPVKVLFRKTEPSIYREIFSFSVWTTVIGVAQRITYNMAPSIFAATCGSVAVALYAPISSLGSYYYAIAVAINGLFLPKISRMIAEHREDGILPLMVKVGRFQTAVLGLILVGFACVGDEFLTLWLGKDFAQAYVGGILIMLPALFEYSQQIGNTAIVAKNYVKEKGLVLMGTSLVGFGLSCWLSSAYGLAGGCTAICLTGFANVFGNNYIHRKKLNIDIVSFYRQCYSSMLLPAIVTAAAGRLLVVGLGGMTIGWLAVKIVLICIVYCVLLFAVGLKKHERRAVCGVLGHLIRRR